MLLYIFRELMTRHFEEVRLMLLSAAGSPRSFAEFFSDLQEPSLIQPSVLSVSGELVPLVVRERSFPLRIVNMDPWARLEGTAPSATPSAAQRRMVVALVRRIAPVGASVLVFLPDLEEILAVQAQLQRCPPACPTTGVCDVPRGAGWPSVEPVPKGVFHKISKVCS